MRSMRRPLVNERMISRTHHGGLVARVRRKWIGFAWLRRAILGLIVLARHPPPDVRGTVAKDNTSASFVLSQEADCVAIREDQIHKI
jgi:hypothetical protein